MSVLQEAIFKWLVLNKFNITALTQIYNKIKYYINYEFIIKTGSI